MCVFNLSAISQAFNGPFKYQENSRSAWLPYPNPNPNFQVISGGPGPLLPQESRTPCRRPGTVEPPHTPLSVHSAAGSPPAVADRPPLSLAHGRGPRPFVSRGAWAVKELFVGWNTRGRTEKGQHKAAGWESKLQLVLMVVDSVSPEALIPNE